MNDVLGWYVYDPKTGQLVIRCTTRTEARRIAAECDGCVAKIVKVH